MSSTLSVVLTAIPEILSLLSAAEPIAANLITEAEAEIASLTGGAPVTVTLAEVQTAIAAEEAANAALQADTPAASAG